MSIKVVSYDPHWCEKYAEEEKRLKTLFGDLPIVFHHIGSTSIPGCAAKPIIDILGVTHDILEVDRFSLEGYEALGEFGMKQRRFFQKKGEVHLHIFEDSDPEAARHLKFRDFLREHPKKVEEYSDLKGRLAEKCSDMQSYILGKEHFIKDIDFKAAEKDRGAYWNHKVVQRRKVWSNDQVLNAMEVNMQLHMTYFAKYVHAMEIVYEPDVVVVRSDLPDDTFNYVLGARFAQNEVRKRVQEVCAHFQNPFSWWVGESDEPHNLQEELKACGLEPKEEDVGMRLFLEGIDFEREIEELSIERAFSLKDFAQVFLSIGAFPEAYEEFFSKIPHSLYGKGAPFEFYVGYIEGEPVVAGILVLHANVGGIYYVMTDPSFRRRGYGSEMMKSLTMRAKERGYHLCTLQASASGRSLYERLGFERICLFVEYSKQ
ncbi:MAG: GNAT family N-acetyltransferase [Chlamydiales bacterium]|nr:GNAT family N-acetyltransferase [Chlamydiales bacterium]